MVIQQLVVILLVSWDEVISNPSILPSCPPHTVALIQSKGIYFWLVDLKQLFWPYIVK